jgi:hypothetical protein
MFCASFTLSTSESVSAALALVASGLSPIDYTTALIEALVSARLFLRVLAR